MEFLDKLLNYYNLTFDDYRSICLHHNNLSLLDYKNIDGINEIVNRIKHAIENKEKILIYGDYDCDGIVSTSILKRTFDLLSYPVSFYIPSRYIDGYGLNSTNVEKIALKDFKLIICVDNGISQNEAVEKANELGIDVIIVDHHELPSVLPNAFAILHPIYSKISPNVVASGGYTTLFLSAALLNKYDEYLVTLAGLSVISDLMELKGYNIDVVLLSIEYFKKYKYLPLKLLLDGDIINEKSLGCEIAPKINAVGRMVTNHDANLVVNYLISEDENEIYRIYHFIKDINEERKSETKNAIELLNTYDFNNTHGIVMVVDFKEGLLGLIANRLMYMYNVPAVLFAVDSNNPEYLKGSVRSKEGFNIINAFDNLNDLLVNHGGHAFSGGLTIKKSDFDVFKTRFLDICESHHFINDNSNFIEIRLNEVNMENYNILEMFSPFGMGNKEPIFKISNIPTQGLKFISFGKHLSTPLTISSKLLGFNMSEDEIKKYSFINIFGNFNLSSFMKTKTLEFRINEYDGKE